MHGFLKGSFFFSCCYFYFCFCYSIKQNDPASKMQDFFYGIIQIFKLHWLLFEESTDNKKNKAVF